MLFAQVVYNDLYELAKFQPEGWPDIVPAFKFYIDSEFCKPIKAILKGKIVGLGACILFDDTAWLAHIIVLPECRNKGIGFEIVDKLVQYIKLKPINSILLIATESGMPVYLKAGFRITSEYQFYKREKPWTKMQAHGNIFPYHNKYRRDVLELDRRVSGEDRGHLIQGQLSGAYVCLQQDIVTGLYIPDLGEGPIIADNREAGFEFMKMKYSSVDKAVLPIDNLAGNHFLLQNGFSLTGTKGTRMILGNEVPWFPEKIYSRISGNFG
jgi:GNAT superfamily N-acetyltransferase